MALANDIYIIYYKSENHGKINCSFLLYIRTLNIDVRPGSSNCKVPSKHRLVARAGCNRACWQCKGMACYHFGTLQWRCWSTLACCFRWLSLGGLVQVLGFDMLWQKKIHRLTKCITNCGEKWYTDSWDWIDSWEWVLARFPHSPWLDWAVQGIQSEKEKSTVPSPYRNPMEPGMQLGCPFPQNRRRTEASNLAAPAHCSCTSQQVAATPSAVSSLHQLVTRTITGTTEQFEASLI